MPETLKGVKIIQSFLFPQQTLKMGFEITTNKKRERKKNWNLSLFPFTVYVIPVSISEPFFFFAIIVHYYCSSILLLHWEKRMLNKSERERERERERQKQEKTKEKEEKSVFFSSRRKKKIKKVYRRRCYDIRCQISNNNVSYASKHEKN